MPRPIYERLVSGLRDYQPPSEVRIYNSTGQLLRVEKPKDFNLKDTKKNASQTIESD